MLAFVTGGTGFVGSNPVAALTNRGTIPAAVAAVGPAWSAVAFPSTECCCGCRLAAVYADGSKARTELGVPCTPFRTAVQSAYDWYLENH